MLSQYHRVQGDVIKCAVLSKQQQHILTSENLGPSEFAIFALKITLQQLLHYENSLLLFKQSTNRLND